MDNTAPFKIPENITNVDQMKGFIEAIQVSFEQLIFLNKSIDIIAKDTKDIKDYLTLANGFQSDLKIIKNEILDDILTEIKKNTDTIKSIIENDFEELKEKIDNSSLSLSKTIYNKILSLALASAGSIGVIFYAIEKILYSSTVKDIIQEVLKSLPK